MRAGILILAGGRARRLPGKLTLDAGGVPLLVRTYRRVAEKGRERYISCSGTLSAEIDAELDAPLVVDRTPQRGPLGGMLSALPLMRSAFVFVAAADAPHLDAALIAELEAAYRDGDEAVVPVHGDAASRRLEPLAALYERAAVMREAPFVLRERHGALHALLDRLRVRTARVAESTRLRSVNTPHDYAALRSTWWAGA